MASDGTADRRTRQVALVAVCLLGLLVAAFAAPNVSASGPGVGPPGGGGGGGGSVPTGDPGSGDGGGAGIEDLLRWILDRGNGTDGEQRERTPIDREDRQPRDPEPDACSIRFVEEPLPGETVGIKVTKGYDEIEDARVTLNGEFVGRTNTYGRVEVQVPYERRLVLSATLPSDVTCARVARSEDLGRPDAGGSHDATSRLESTTGPAGLGATAVVAEVATRTAGPSAATAAEAALATDGRVRQQDDGDDELTRSESIDAPVNITVRGRPIPGETVELFAQVETENGEEAPMRLATVTVDGEEVGKTDAQGEYDLALPADGRTRITVRVSRGDFNGTKTVQLAQLRASLSPTTVIAIPGGDTRVRATLGDQPVADAVVSYDGQRLGETNAQGRTIIALPSELTATITVEAAGQRTTKAVWPLYAGTALLGALGVVAAVLVLGLLVFGASWVVRFLRWLASAVLRLAKRLEGSLDWLRIQVGRLRDWLADLLGTGRESVPALLGRLGSWLLDLPGKALAGVLTVLGWVRAGLLWLWRAPGRLWRWLWSLGESEDDDEDTDEAATVADDEGSTVVDEGPTSLRERWRAFARWVSPRDWRKRTPGEVARDAVATGFPDDPVETLTDAFRDVEYGNVPLSDRRREQTREAFESLSAHRRGSRGRDGDADRPPAGRSDSLDDADRPRSTDGGRNRTDSQSPSGDDGRMGGDP